MVGRHKQSDFVIITNTFSHLADAFVQSDNGSNQNQQKSNGMQVL